MSEKWKQKRTLVTQTTLIVALKLAIKFAIKPGAAVHAAVQPAQRLTQAIMLY